MPPPGSRPARAVSALATALLMCACGSSRETHGPASGGAKPGAGEGASESRGAPSGNDVAGHEAPFLQTGVPLLGALRGALLGPRLGGVGEAPAGARDVISRQPGNAEAHYVLGLALEQKGSLDEAVAEMRRAHDLSPARPGALNPLLTIDTRRG